MNAAQAGGAVALGACALLLASCSEKRGQSGPPESPPTRPTAQTVKQPDATVVETALDDFVEVSRRDDAAGGYSALVGAYAPDVGGVPGAAIGKSLFDRESQGKETVPAVELESGWMYVISPPRWPIVRTPRQRGGVQAGVAEPDISVHVLTYTDGRAERIFFLGAFDASGRPATCVLHVDANPPHTSNPASRDLTIGQYAEVTLDPITLDWSDIAIGQFPITDTNAPPDVRAFVNYVRLRAANHGMAWNMGLVVP